MFRKFPLKKFYSIRNSKSFEFPFDFESAGFNDGVDIISDCMPD